MQQYPQPEKIWVRISVTFKINLDSKGGEQSGDDKDENDPYERRRWNQPSQFAFRLLRFRLARIRSEGSQLEDWRERHPGSAAQMHKFKNAQMHKLKNAQM